MKWSQYQPRKELGLIGQPMGETENENYNNNYLPLKVWEMNVNRGGLVI